MNYYFNHHAPSKSEYQLDGTKISKEQYDNLVAAIYAFSAVPPKGKYYQLQIDGTWELRDLPAPSPIEEEPALTTRMAAMESRMAEIESRSTPTV